MHYLNFRPPHIKDLEALEPAFYNSLLWIQESDPEPLDLTFTVEEVGVMLYRMAMSYNYLFYGASVYSQFQHVSSPTCQHNLIM